MVQEKLRAVFYARVSTEEERQLNALEKQVAECKDAVILPVVRAFPMEQIPMTMEQKTMGKIIMFRAFM